MPGHYYIPALYNAAMKISVYECFSHTHARTHQHTHTLILYLHVHSNDEFIMNVLLECIKFLTGTHGECFIREYPSDI